MILAINRVIRAQTIAFPPIAFLIASAHQIENALLRNFFSTDDWSSGRRVRVDNQATTVYEPSRNSCLVRMTTFTLEILDLLQNQRFTIHWPPKVLLPSAHKLQ